VHGAAVLGVPVKATIKEVSVYTTLVILNMIILQIPICKLCRSCSILLNLLHTSHCAAVILSNFHGV
jgi:hypothetical protein